ncbi:putative pilin/flagellin [Halapricum desulfuricans]|uniref:Putative pilin/flagellin n=1 Tax=Halapricum desulfuricans TaxID=2841257 RepID=A0A897NH61_9EURY|nr:putative pilin/flagellin [Halapricum desulfuricans]QSG12052.1 putative pilin/flagellin [Halapricum desulfuricans]
MKEIDSITGNVPSGGSSTDRGQAYTLEGIISAIVVLTALLYALQAVTITPTTGGTVDQGVRTEIKQQAEDILTVSGSNDTGHLSELARNWSQRRQTFYGAVNPRIGYGTEQLPGPLGTMLNETFDERDRMYNVEMRYLPKNQSDGIQRTVIASRGTPADSAVVASYRITLYDNMTLTSPTAGSAELWQYDTYPTRNPVDGKSGYYPVPNAVPGPVYNIVEIRVIVW